MPTPNDIDYEGHLYDCPRHDDKLYSGKTCTCGFGRWNAARNRGEMAHLTAAQQLAALVNWRRHNMMYFMGLPSVAPQIKAAMERGASIFESGECWVAPERTTSPGLEVDAPRPTELPAPEQLAYAAGWRAGRQALRAELRATLTKGESDDNHDGQ